MLRPSLECPCDGSFLSPDFTYEEAPLGETKFDLAGQGYQRSYERCSLCLHWFGRHNLDLTGLYAGDYASATYGDRMGTVFDRIVGLPPENSDNTGRRNRLLKFAHHWLGASPEITLLDVGSGLGVFPYAMRLAGWSCTALDPDPLACEHIAAKAEVATIAADFLEVDPLALGSFDVVTLNKVIEHVEEPCEMLRKASLATSSRGFVYVEVPDGEMAAAKGPEREEFFIEHHHVFSAASLGLALERSGLRPISIERLREPSGKYTLAGFATAHPSLSQEWNQL
jgi:hypothetical protein